MLPAPACELPQPLLQVAASYQLSVALVGWRQDILKKKYPTPHIRTTLRYIPTYLPRWIRPESFLGTLISPPPLIHPCLRDRALKTIFHAK